MAEIVKRDYNTYTGKVLKSWFKSAMRECERFTHIDSWWDRKGENEIDIIAADDLENSVTFYEVKRQRNEVDLKALEKKVQRFKEVTGEYNSYVVNLDGLGIDDYLFIIRGGWGRSFHFDVGVLDGIKQSVVLISSLLNIWAKACRLESGELGEQ